LPRGLASAAISFISAGVSWKSKISAFSFSRSVRPVLGNHNDVLLHQVAQADLCRRLAMRPCRSAPAVHRPATRPRAIGV
jgi:hypothetical protein